MQTEWRKKNPDMKNYTHTWTSIYSLGENVGDKVHHTKDFCDFLDGKFVSNKSDPSFHILEYTLQSLEEAGEEAGEEARWKEYPTTRGLRSDM